MRRLLTFALIAAFCAFSLSHAEAQTLQAPPQLQQVLVLKTQATQSVHAILQPGQRDRIDTIARLTQSDLNHSFGDVNAADGPLLSIFSVQQLTELAAALREGREPNLSDAQMSKVAQYMGDIIMKAGPTWQSHASQVDSLLTPAQRDRIGALRTSVLSRLPNFSFLGFNMFGQLSTMPLVGLMADPGSFVLLLSLPGVQEWHGLPRRQASAK